MFTISKQFYLMYLVLLLFMLVHLNRHRNFNTSKTFLIDICILSFSSRNRHRYGCFVLLLWNCLMQNNKSISSFFNHFSSFLFTMILLKQMCCVSETDIRFINNSLSGIVEANISGRWHKICREAIGFSEASLICQSVTGSGQ